MTAELFYWSLFALAVGVGMWGAVKQHGHTSIEDGGTLSLSSSSLADSAVTTAKLAADAVTTAKITDANVTTAKLAASAVTSAKIAAASVGSSALKTSTAYAAASFAAGSLTVTQNDYSFAPSEYIPTNFDVTSLTRTCITGSDPGTYNGAFRYTWSGGSGGTMVIRWQYITASDDPIMEIAYDPVSGAIRGIWAADDPLRNHAAGIEIPGCVNKLFKSSDLNDLNISDHAKTAAAEYIAAKNLKTEHLLIRALEIDSGNASGRWVLERCKIDIASGRLILLKT